VLVGRDRELDELGGALARLGAGQGGLYLLAGEPGIGKSRLASEVAAIARDRASRVAWGRCWEGGGAPAFWPWREALDALGVAFPDARALTTNDPNEARFALYREIAAALGREAAGAPLVIVFEDLHAADHASLALLELAAGQLRAMRAIIVGTYRPLEASLRPELGDALARLGRAGRVLELAPLRAPEVAALVRDAIDGADDALARTVYETTHGNPLFVDEIVRDLRARGPGAPARVPLGVREIIRQRLGLVAPDARTALEAGAVLGVELDAAIVARMVPGAGAALDDAVRSGLAIAAGDRLRFSHALYREALYHDLARPRREELHRAAARALAATGASPAAIAHHLLEGGPTAADGAIDHATQAAEQALAMLAYDDAIALLERARRAIPTGEREPALRARVLLALGEARIAAGDAAGRTLCVDAAAIARELADAPLLARAALAYGAVLVMGTVDGTMVRLLEDALAGLGADHAPLRARVMARLAAARQPSPPRDRPRDVALALEAVALGREVAHGRDLLAILQAASGALYGMADPRLRVSIAREAERLAEELGDSSRLLQARVRLAMDLLELGDFASYAQVADAYERPAARLGPSAGPWRVPLMRSMLALARDDFAGSERWQAESRRIDAERPQARRAQAFHRIAFLRAAERHAELRAAIPELRSLWLAMPIGKLIADGFVVGCLARIGDADEIRAIVGAMPDEAFEEHINAPGLLEAAWAIGDAELARRTRAWLLEQSHRNVIYWLDTEIVEAPASRLLAHAAAMCGEHADAERHFATAVAAIEANGRRSLLARLWFEYGDLLVRLGRDVERARALIGRGRALAAEVGLPELVALIDRRHPPHGAAVAPARFAMTLEGEYYAIPSARGPLRFKASRGMQYLAELVARAGEDIHVLELAGATDADRGDAGELLDPEAFKQYRARVAALREEVDDADARGDGDAAERARAEMEAIAGELGRATGLGGRARRGESAVDRARSAVTRRIKDALDRIAEQDPELGASLRRAVRTGNHCSYRPSS
jgi:hypothetical protein